MGRVPALVSLDLNSVWLEPGNPLVKREAAKTTPESGEEGTLVFVLFCPLSRVVFLFSIHLQPPAPQWQM